MSGPAPAKRGGVEDEEAGLCETAALPAEQASSVT